MKLYMVTMMRIALMSFLIGVGNGCMVQGAEFDLEFYKNLVDALEGGNKEAQSDEMRLIQAIKSKDLSAVENLVARGLDVNTKDSSGDTPLMIAAGLRYSDIVDLLIKAGADVNLENNLKETALSLALEAYLRDLIERKSYLYDDSASNTETINYVKQSAIDNIKHTINSLLKAGARFDSDKLINIITAGKASIKNFINNNFEREALLKDDVKAIDELQQIFTALDILEKNKEETEPLDFSTMSLKAVELFLVRLINSGNYNAIADFYNNYKDQLPAVGKNIAEFITKWKAGSLNANQNLLKALLTGQNSSQFAQNLEMQVYELARNNNYSRLGALIRNWARNAYEISKLKTSNNIEVPSEIVSHTISY